MDASIDRTGRSVREADVAQQTRVTGTSLEGFDDAARQAFDDVPGDPDREGLASADVSRMWLSKGGFVGRVQYHVELDVAADPAGA
jgi:hypothetical protein